MSEREEIIAKSEHLTFCRICECLCGLIATVENDEIVDLRPNPDHPITQGFSCPKGLSMRQVTHHPERILYPQRKKADGSFERVSWETALKEIGERLNSIRAEYGSDAIGFYEGGGTGFSYSAFPWERGMAEALDTPHVYGATSVDVNPRMVASHFLYGSQLAMPVPDLHHTDFLLMLGANPVVSHGSSMGNIKARKALNGIVDRGGRVVVVDPRNTETAKYFEHLPIPPARDAFLLLSILHVVFAEGLDSLGAAEGLVTGLEALKNAVKPYPPEVTAQHTRLSPEVVTQLARDFAKADSAVAWGRVGTCTNAHGTLSIFLYDALNVVTGNADKRGGAIWPDAPWDYEKNYANSPIDNYGGKKSRIGGYPAVLGCMPSAILADEITTPGKGQLRAFIMVGGNPAVAIPESGKVREALQKLDLLVSLDFNFSDSNQYADYILPVTTFLEREEPIVPAAHINQQVPFHTWTDPVISPRGESRPEWQIIRDICAEMKIVPSASPFIRRLGWLGRRLTPKFMYDLMLRLSPKGDLFGLRPGGLSINMLRKKHPHGLKLAEEGPLGILPGRLFHEDKLLHLFCDEIAVEIRRLRESTGHDEKYPFTTFGRREMRKINSWLKNAEMVRVGEPGPACVINPEDAKWLGLSEGELGRIRSRTGSIEARFEISEDVIPGSVAIPHGWSMHSSKDLGTKNEHFIANEVIPAEMEPPSGQAILCGVPVQIEAVNDYRKVAN